MTITKDEAGKEAIVEGHVLRDGTPVATGYARLLGTGDEFVAEVPLGEDGGFRFFAAPGDWTLRVLAPGGVRARVRGLRGHRPDHQGGSGRLGKSATAGTGVNRLYPPSSYASSLRVAKRKVRFCVMNENREEFQRDLERIEAKVIELFAMVAEDLPRATDALLSGDNDALAVLIERELDIDALWPEIEELVNREIVLQAPVAVDLRYLLSVLRIVPVLERAHDLVISIGSRANHSLGEELTPRSRVIVERMSELASAMWRQAADAWYQRDKTVASSLSERDEEMDELHSSLTAELASGQMSVQVAMEMALVARDYERLGAHAVNIARRVVYLAGSTPESPPGS